MNQSFLRHWPLAVLAAILAIAAAVRIYRIGEASLWEDERDSVMSAEGHFAEWETMPTNRLINPPDLVSVQNARPWLDTWRTPDFHPPLYAMLLRIWRDWFGESDATARSLSVVASLAAIVFLFDLARSLVDSTAALWACAIMALAQPQILYAQEARDYALWTALGLGACAAAARLSVRGPGWRRAAALAGCTVGMLLTHFLAVISVAAIALWCVVYLRGRALKQATIAGVAALVFLIAVGSGLPSQAHQTSRDIGWAKTDTGPGHTREILRQVALLPAHFLARPRDGTQAICSVSAVAFVLPWIMCRWPKGANRNGIMFFCALWMWAAIAPIAVADITLGTGTVRVLRYSLIAAPAYYLLLAALPVRSWLRALAPLAALLGCAAAVPDSYDGLWKGDWRHLGTDVRHLAGPNDILVLANPPEAYLAKPVQIYDGIIYYCHPLPCRVVLLNRAADAELCMSFKNAAHVWVVSTTPPQGLDSFIPGWHFVEAAPLRYQVGRVWRAEK